MKNDNRIENLRVVTRSQNQINRSVPKNNTSGFKGVNWNEKLGKWMARCAVKGKRIHLGYFNEMIDAVNAYKSAIEIYHGEYIRQEI